MGIDPAWGTDSQFAIVITLYRNNKVEVFHAESVTQPYFADIINRIMELKMRHHVSKLYIDGANPEVDGAKAQDRRVREIRGYDRRSSLGVS